MIDEFLSTVDNSLNKFPFMFAKKLRKCTLLSDQLLSNLKYRSLGYSKSTLQILVRSKVQTMTNPSHPPKYISICR